MSWTEWAGHPLDGDTMSSATSSCAVQISQHLNKAHRCNAAGDADGVMAALRAVRGLFFDETKESPEGQVSLIPEYAMEVANAAFLKHESSAVRKFVIQFCEDVVKKVPQMAARVVPAYRQLVRDPEKVVVMRVISGESA